jgi:pSer/pThr/pTyr-binding forkhead associated (FHA) protein
LGNVPLPSVVKSPSPLPQPAPIPPQPTPSQRQTPPIPVDDATNYQPRPPIPPTPPIQPSYTPQPPRLPFLKLIHTSGREFQWSGETGIIGRRSQTKTPPEIEITGIPNEGVVSRHHARVSWDWSQNAYMISDMSTNGIYLNGNPLSPSVQYRLMNGDSLQLGQDNLVRFTVYVV